jgi:hypothetical protein
MRMLARQKNHDDLILPNHETSKGIQKIFINHTSSEEVYDHSTIIINSCFSTIISENVLTNLDPKTMAEFKRRSDWNKWKEIIEAELKSLRK